MFTLCLGSLVFTICLLDIQISVFRRCVICVYSVFTSCALLCGAYEESELALVFTCIYYLCLRDVVFVFIALTRNGLVFTTLPLHSCTVLLCLRLLVFIHLFSERCVGVFVACLAKPSPHT